MTPVLQISDLSITAGAQSDTPFRLDVPDLTLGAGTCAAMTGPSGCGKSTLLEVLGLLRPPHKVGRFAFCPGPGAEVLDLTQAGDWTTLRQGPIGYVPQMGGVLPFTSARDYVEATLRLAGCANTETGTSRLTWLTAQLGLADHLEKRRDELSGGQRKRVALLAGLSVPRALLIADEPTAGLDVEAAHRVMQLLAKLALHEQTAMVIATHDVDAARATGFIPHDIKNGRLCAPEVTQKEPARV